MKSVDRWYGCVALNLAERIKTKTDNKKAKLFEANASDVQYPASPALNWSHVYCAALGEQ